MLDVRVRRRLPDFELDLAFRAEDEVLVLFGPSGSGKTMTLRMIAGLDRPDAGEIRLRERVLFSSDRGVSLRPRERRCGFVFQELALFPHLTVARNLRYGARGEDGRTEQRLARLLDTFRLRHLADRHPVHLSGGERQRVALARALMSEPDVLLLDEPFTALDYATRDAVYEELLEAQRTWRIPFLLVTHEQREAEKLGDRVLHLQSGRETPAA